MAASTGFNIVSDLFKIIDNVLDSMVISNVATVIEIATPIVAICLAIKFVLQGAMMTLSPDSGEPLSEIVREFFRVIMIMSFATAGGLYQTDLISLAQNLPDTLATQFQGLNNTTYTGIAGIIDGGIQTSIDAINSQFDASGISADGLLSLVIGCILIVPTILLGGLGAGFVILAKVFLSITLCFGPAAIFCKLWRPTKSIFDKWLGLLINYTLVVIVIAIVFGLLMTLFANMIKGLTEGDGQYDSLSSAIGLCILTVVTVLALFQAPSFASSLGSGISAHVGEAMRTATQSMGGLSSLGGMASKGVMPKPKGQGPASSNGGASGGQSANGSAGSKSQLSGMARGSRGRAA